MRRRDVLFVGGAAVLWPVVAHGQQPREARRVGILMPLAQDDPEAVRRIAAFERGLHQMGWGVGRDVQIITRWGGGNPEEIRRHATELVALAPDAIIAAGPATAGPLVQATRAVPIVLVHVVDPVGAGFVNSLARPGGNATGFLQFEYSIGGKWLELLRQVAPGVTRAAVIRDPAVSSGVGQFGAIQTAAPALGIEPVPVNVREAAEIERDVAAFGRLGRGGLIVTASASAAVHRDFIIGTAARHKLPAVYYERNFAAAGGLISYGPDLVDQFGRAAGYVDRILKGEGPDQLPVQAPVKYELVINLKTAAELGLTVPATLLARADEVIE